MDKILVPTTLEDEGQTPHYASQEAAGADVYAAVSKDVVIAPGESTLISTGIRVAIPKGYEIQVRPRSGLAYKHGVTVLNTPGTIDSDYRGVVGIILINHGKDSFTVTPKMRIAQLVLAKVELAHFLVEDALATTERGEGGFGHSGTH
ncbi:MAG: dUTP diphosphatase [Simkaniaceae bacterium]|nr:dUTP diphosphatase [Simkaniaceae bacterium]